MRGRGQEEKLIDELNVGFLHHSGKMAVWGMGERLEGAEKSHAGLAPCRVIWCGEPGENGCEVRRCSGGPSQGRDGIGLRLGVWRGTERSGRAEPAAGAPATHCQDGL